MLIVLLDEPGLFVFPTPTHAEQAIEPIDAESEIRAAFDESAVPYTVEWIEPNRRRQGVFFSSIEPGQYRFVSAGNSQPNALIKLLTAHSGSTNPPEAKAHLDALLARLRAL